MHISSVRCRALLPLFLVGSFVSASVSVAQDADDRAPLLTLDQAIQIAMQNNRTLKIASLEVDKSKWQVASTKTKRLPDTTAYLFGSGLLNSPTFSFRQGLFGEVGNTPVPARNMNVPLSAGPTAYVVLQATQLLSQFYKIHLAVRQQELAVGMNNEKFRAQRQSTAATVKDAYYAVLQTESALQAEQASVKQYEGFCNMFRKKPRSSRIAWM
jgi:outer membrane protein